MNALQGRYLKRVNSKSGKLKGLKIKGDKGTQTVYLPKDLRDIAEQELTIGDSVRVWTTQRKKGAKAKKNRQPSETLWVVQLIPLTPKTEVGAETVDSKELLVKEAKKDAKGKEAKGKKAKKGKKKKAAKGMTVQLCQKKNCCKRGGTQLWSTFESVSEAASEVPFKLEAVGCLGGCKRGPNIRFLPDNVKHYHVQPKDVEALLARHG